jgi:hypothetical protein
MTLMELISKLNLNLFVKSPNVFKKIMPLFDKDYIIINIPNEKNYDKENYDEENYDEEEDDEFIDLELGNGFKLINEEKTLYFYNKV